MHIFTVSFPNQVSLAPLAGLSHSLLVRTTPLFYLLGDPSFGDRGANVHPLPSLDSDQLFTPCFLTLPNPPLTPMIHVTCLQRRHHNISYTV
jgi:hypothetical protein